MTEERVERRLAAIVAADMVGYSRLMEADETDTLVRQKAILSELIYPKVSEFGGRIVKTTGDGALIEFSSAVNAVLCSVAVQREMANREVDTPEKRRIAYRIGINLGEIIHDGDDIFGDGVNVASRIEGLAKPGGIHISEAVFNNVKGKLDLGFADLGPQKVKNLAELIPTFEVLLDPSDAGKLVKQKGKRSPVVRNATAAVTALAVLLVSGYVGWDRFKSADTEEEKLLVLPFKAENSTSRQVAEAATQNLIASLARLNGLVTASHTVSMEYKGIGLETDELPTELGVRYVLDGSAKQLDDRIDLSARLRDFRASGDVVWEQTVEGEKAQLFDLLATLKQNAVASMKVTLKPTERDILEAQPTENTEAYLAFAEAERFRYSGNFFELEKSLPLYEKAMDLDPAFIGAQIGYAEVNFTIWKMSYNTIRFTPDALEVAEETIVSILEADSTNPYAIGLQVRINIELLNHEQAVSEARGAVFLQPDEPWLRNVLGLALLTSGMYDDAKEEFASYEALSPRLSSEEKRDLAFQYLLLDDAKKALSLLTSVPAEETDRIEQYENMANAHARLGNMDIAKTYMDKFLKETVWISVAWQKGYFGIFTDPAIFKEWTAAMLAAGFPESPLDFETGRENDRLLHSDLVGLFSEKYQEVHTIGPFGMPYTEDRRTDGTLQMHFTWMKGQVIGAQWYIKGDQFCYHTPAIHVDREECNNVYINQEKSTDRVKYISNVYSIGAINSEFRRAED